MRTPEATRLWIELDRETRLHDQPDADEQRREAIDACLADPAWSQVMGPAVASGDAEWIDDVLAEWHEALIPEDVRAMVPAIVAPDGSFDVPLYTGDFTSYDDLLDEGMRELLNEPTWPMPYEVEDAALAALLDDHRDAHGELRDEAAMPYRTEAA